VFGGGGVGGGGGGRKNSVLFSFILVIGHIFFGLFCSIQCNSQLDNEIEPSATYKVIFFVLKKASVCVASVDTLSLRNSLELTYVHPKHN